METWNGASARMIDCEGSWTVTTVYQGHSQNSTISRWGTDSPPRLGGMHSAFGPPAGCSVLGRRIIHALAQALED